MERNEKDAKKAVDLIENSFWASESSGKNTPNVDSKEMAELASQNTELKSKLKKSKDEIVKLKEKIKSQNEDIEEALKQLMKINKEKENTKIYLSGMY